MPKIKIKVYWFQCPKCKAAYGGPRKQREPCRNCGTKMRRVRLKDL